METASAKSCKNSKRNRTSNSKRPRERPNQDRKGPVFCHPGSCHPENRGFFDPEDLYALRELQILRQDVPFQNKPLWDRLVHLQKLISSNILQYLPNSARPADLNRRYLGLTRQAKVDPLVARRHEPCASRHVVIKHAS